MAEDPLERWKKSLEERQDDFEYFGCVIVRQEALIFLQNCSDHPDEIESFKVANSFNTHFC